MKCNLCNSENVKEVKHHHVENVKNHIIEFDMNRMVCQDCKNIISNKELDDKFNRELIRLYNIKYGIQAEDIVLLRKKLNLSQELFAKIIGCAKKTLVSYEVGYSIPNDIYMGVLKLINSDNSVILELLAANKDNYTKTEYEKIINRINIKKNTNTKVDNNELINNIILYFSENGVSKTKVMSLMFLADYDYYMKYGKTITNLEYVNNYNFINILKFEDIIIGLINNHKLELIYDVSGNKEMSYIKSNHIVNSSDFKDDVYKVLDEIKKSHKLLSVEQTLKEVRENEVFSRETGKITM